MRKVVQISDLHFGNNDARLLEPLRRAIEEIAPDVLIISGDLVEHASKAEFEAARDFLRTLPKPQMVVPGNHDLPFYNLFARATIGLSYYKSLITDDLSPKFEDDEIAIFGANTSRFWPELTAVGTAGESFCGRTARAGSPVGDTPSVRPAGRARAQTDCGTRAAIY